MTTYVTVIAEGYGDSGGTGSQDATSPGGVTTPGTGVTGTGQPAAGSTSVASPVLRPTGLAQRIMASAIALQSCPYVRGRAGPDGAGYDCSGLVCAAASAQGFTGLVVVGGGPGYNTDIGPSGLWTYFQGKGAVPYQGIEQAQPGDLLFVQHGSLVYNPDGSSGYPNGQAGFSHVAFCYQAGGVGSGQNYGANSETIGLTVSANRYWHDFYGLGFTQMLDMSTVHL